MRTLRFISGPHAGETREIVGELVLGREQADVELSDEEVSRQHTVVRAVDNGVEVEDLGSRNGTFVNERRIEEKLTLTNSASMRIGQTRLQIDVALPQVTKLAAAPPEPIAEPPLASPDLTRERPIATPDATVQRPIATPDVTVQRPIATPDATVQRPIATPDLTVQRPIATPDVTVQRPVASPEATTVRPTASPTAPAGPAPGASSPHAAAPRSLSAWLPWIVGGLVLAIAIAVTLSLILK